jgi:hypothetical protein
MMMLSVSVWDLQAKSVDQQFAFVVLGHHAIITGLTVYLLLT